MEYSVKLTEQELGILSAALVELPFKAAAPLIANINRQIAEQDKRREGSGSESGESGA